MLGDISHRLKDYKYVTLLTVPKRKAEADQIVRKYL